MIKPKLFFLGAFFLLSHSLMTESYSGAAPEEATIMRAPVWVFLEHQPDADPKKIADTGNTPLEGLHEVAAFVMTGMTYGWKFSYTPSDKKRNVSEYFELEPIYRVKRNDKNLKVLELTASYPYLYSWAEYKISENVAKRRTFWKSITYKTFQGRGTGERNDEIEGIIHAYTEATKTAIRNYARTIKRNKPREVIGEVLIKESPRLFAARGQFIADIEVYIHIKEIVPYTTF